MSGRAGASSIDAAAEQVRTFPAPTYSLRLVPRVAVPIIAGPSNRTSFRAVIGQVGAAIRASFIGHPLLYLAHHNKGGLFTGIQRYRKMI